MSKKKSKHKITHTDTQRFILRDGEKLHLTNETGVELLITAFPAVRHKPEFDEYVSGGYWLHNDGQYTAMIKVSGEGWFGGAVKLGEKSVPLHGPYRSLRKAKRVALDQLTLIRAEDDEEITTYLCGGCR